MPDRVRGRDMRLRVDTGSTAGPVTVTVYDALGVEVSTGAASFVGGGYWTVLIPVSDDHPDGVWKAIWTTPGGDIDQEFTVGEEGYMQKHVVRARIASRVAETFYGAITFHNNDKVVDNSLYGASNEYRGFWFVPAGDSVGAGMPRRVIAYSGTSLTLSESYPFQLPAGIRYELVRDVSPFEIDDALDEVVSSLRIKDRPTLHARGLPVVEFDSETKRGEVVIPNGWDYVSGVYITIPDCDPIKLKPEQWSLQPGRLVRIEPAHEDALIDLIGARDARSSVWDDSWLDINPAILIPATAHRLHVSRARGASTDPDEHLRRTVMAYQEFEDASRRFRQRVPNNQREVIT